MPPSPGYCAAPEASDAASELHSPAGRLICDCLRPGKGEHSFSFHMYEKEHRAADVRRWHLQRRWACRTSGSEQQERFPLLQEDCRSVFVLLLAALSSLSLAFVFQVGGWPWSLRSSSPSVTFPLSDSTPGWFVS